MVSALHDVGFVRLELRRRDAPDIEPSVVVWANLDPEARKEDGVSQRAAGVEVSIAGASRVRSAVVAALSATRAPDGDERGTSKSSMIGRSVEELFADIGDFGQIIAGGATL
ncbi:hypothetical protein [Methylobacterium planeticum]|uniref:Uncharacterized protein n=1 Tax=Methylobacterium planeticum TaxID=2615211 RepID=A0A6N6MGK8_9HYPH|nr:hypothetical protein [Methylobacterium planeticum]KAB1068556.1 hypothetical protein F6X51_26710 [Methylobacterium planeticum]